MRTSGTIKCRASCQSPFCEQETAHSAQLMQVLGMLLHHWGYLIGDIFIFCILWSKVSLHLFFQSFKHLALLWHNHLLDMSRSALLVMLGSRHVCGTASMVDSRRKTVPCRHFANETCRKGFAGAFAHGLLARLHVVTKNFQKGAAKSREHVTMCCRLLRGGSWFVGENWRR